MVTLCAAAQVLCCLSSIRKVHAESTGAVTDDVGGDAEVGDGDDGGGRVNCADDNRGNGALTNTDGQRRRDDNGRQRLLRTQVLPLEGRVQRIPPAPE